MAYQITSVSLGLQTGADRLVYATWVWSETDAVNKTDHYRWIWYYATGDGVWFVGQDSTGPTYARQCTYSAPSNAVKVKFKVRPYAKTHKTKDAKGEEVDTEYYKGSWSNEYTIPIPGAPPIPAVPSAPSISIDKFKLHGEVDVYDANTTHIEFSVVKNDSSSIAHIESKVKTNHAAFTCNVDAGGRYKVHCRALRRTSASVTGSGYETINVKYYGTIEIPSTKSVKIDLEDYSDWSEYSESVGTIPEAPTITKMRALSDTVVQIHWKSMANTDSYEVEYSTSAGYFDSGTSEVQSVTVESVVSHAEITGLETGRRWVFRVRAVNEQGNSGWSEIQEIYIGKAPAAPTTWSESSTVIVGDPAKLYWTHNAQDGSDQTGAILEYTIAGATNQLEFTTQKSHSFNTSSYSEGATLKWRVRTKGAVPDQYGPWSTQRVVKLYAPPTLSIDSFDRHPTTYPIHLEASAGPSTQRAVGYTLSIVAKQAYDIEDSTGVVTHIHANQEIYQRNFVSNSNSFSVSLTPGDVILQNNVLYMFNLSVAMNSGLTTRTTISCQPEFAHELGFSEPNAFVSINREILAATIQPYCENSVTGDLYSNILLGVYRREYDGRLVEIDSGIPNIRGISVVDPHPALDYARYRIVAINQISGQIAFYDLPAIPIGEPGMVINWDEDWSMFDVTDEGDMEQAPWTGSMLRLPYNVDVTDNNTADVALVDYIGRQHPVSYYGTQLGVAATWNCEISASDIETLYQIRRLSVYQGDVYVRETSGSGYWAQVSISINQKHNEVVIPVTFTIRRVDGGA